MPKSPHASALSDVIAKLAVAGVEAQPKPAAMTPALPGWLRTSLRQRAGLTDEVIDELSFEDAVETWNAWMARPR